MSQTNMYLDCPKCKSTLQYRCNARFVMCPSCKYITNTTAPQQLPCIGCHELITFPPHSLYIRCPKCMITIQIRDHSYKNELLSFNKDNKNIKYESYPNQPPLMRIQCDDSNDSNINNYDSKNNENDNNHYAVINKDMIYSISNQQQQKLQQIISQNQSVNGKRKYKYFDGDLLKNYNKRNEDEDDDDDDDEDEDDDNNHNKNKSILSLPPIQLNTEHEEEQENEDNNNNNNQHRKSSQRILTGYQCYVKEQKPEIIKNNVSMSEIEISNELAINWKELDSKQQQKYIVEAQNIVDSLLDTK